MCYCNDENHFNTSFCSAECNENRNIYCNKGKYNFFSDFSIFLHALVVAECFCRTAETLQSAAFVAPVSTACLSSGLQSVTSSTCKMFVVLLQRLTQNLFKWKEFIAGDRAGIWALPVLGYGNSTSEPRATRWELGQIGPVRSLAPPQNLLVLIFHLIPNVTSGKTSHLF